MRKIITRLGLLSSFLAISISASAQSSYFSVAYNTTVGTATLKVAGDFCVAVDSKNFNNCMLRATKDKGVDITTTTTVSSTVTFRANSFSVGLTTFSVYEGKLGLGIASPAQQLHLTGNVRTPATTATTGIYYQDTTPFLHNFGGTTNVFLGVSAGNLTLSGSSNVCMGSLCNNALTSGSDNGGIGNRVNVLLQDGSSNWCVAAECLENNVSGSNNSGFGERTLEDNTNSNNSCFGFNCFQKVTSGDFNTGLGGKAGVTSVAGNATTTGDAQTYIGYQSGPSNATSLFNATAIGYNATVAISSAMALGGTGTGAVKVAIGTTTPTTSLTVYGVITSSTAVPAIACDAGTGVMAAGRTQPHRPLLP